MKRFWVFGAAVLVAGCGTDGAGERESRAAAESTTTSTQPTAGAESAPQFVDVASQVGIDFVHNTGAFGQKWLPETMGSGCAWLDYDGDGDPDALILSGKDFAGHPTGRRQTCALYRNDGGVFTDVTKQAGVDLPTYALGVTTGDYDSDGDADVYITALGPNRLYRNDGARFVDVAATSGVADAGFGSSTTWLDADKDGDLDLFALNYVQWTPETDVFCSLDGTNKSYCTPEVYPGASARFFRNDGGTFTDRTEAAGIYDPSGKGLGVIAFDFDADGYDDVFVANDTQPNHLWHNQGDGTFSEEAVVAGVAFDEAGRARGAMGVDAADYDGSGRPSLAIGNFSNEMIALYHNEGAGFFIDVAPTSTIGSKSLLTLAFGTFFFDYDLDGLADLFVANGHVENEIQKVQSQVSYAQPMHLFRNLGNSSFRDVAPSCEALFTPIVGRSCAAADYDGDGDLDVLVTVSGGAAKLLRNDSETGNSVRVRLRGGAGSNLDGYGASVQVLAGGRSQMAWARAAQSYCSQNENVITFGTGDASTADEVVVHWPSGKTSRRQDVPAGSIVEIREADAS